MVSQKELQLKNEWWFNEHYQIEEAHWYKRDLFTTVADSLDHPLMLAIVGLRRVGKSTLLKQVIAHLLGHNVPPRHIFYFMFDYASHIQKSEFLETVLSAYFEEILGKPGLQLTERVYVLLDEIQYIHDWQAVLKKYYDLSNKKIKFIVTGSQSIFLKGSYKESLAGRILDYYLPALTFREFLKINNETIQPYPRFDLFNLPEVFSELNGYDAYHGKQAERLAREYMVTGQFPESRQFAAVWQRHEYIGEAVLGKVLEDCIRLFRIEKTDEFKLVAYQLLTNIASIFELKNIGQEVGISKITIENYLAYLQNCYLIEVLYKYHKSPVKRGRVLKKAYTPCSNFTCALNRYTEQHIAEIPEAFGKIAENCIYTALKQKYKRTGVLESLYFWRQGDKEIDFIVTHEKKQLPVEVKFGAVVEAKDSAVLCQYVDKKSAEYGVMVTRNILDKKTLHSNIIYYIPYYLALFMG